MTHSTVTPLRLGASLGALALASLFAGEAGAQAASPPVPTQSAPNQQAAPVAQGSDPAVDTSGNPTLTPAADGPSSANDTGAETTQTRSTAEEQKGANADNFDPAMDIVVT